MTMAEESLAKVSEHGGTIDVFASSSNFENAQRMAKALASSSMVPEAYRGNLPNVLIAIELASRIGASVFAVMQNLDVIHGKPGMRASFLIATVNACGRFKPLRFRWEGKPGSDAWGCRAYAAERDGGEELVGALITIGMAKAEGWYTRNGSKWKTMPEQMLMYRSAAFWQRAFAPELSLGMHTTEEVSDMSPRAAVVVQQVPPKVADLEARIRGEASPETQPAPSEDDGAVGEEREPGSDDA